MRFSYFFLALTLVFSIAACKGKKTGKTETTTTTTTTNNNNTNSTTDALEAEWTLVAMGNEKTDSHMNITFGTGGKFSMVTKEGTVKGTYTKSSDGKKLTLKHEKGEDFWDILTLAEKELVVFDNDPKNKIEYKFTR